MAMSEAPWPKGLRFGESVKSFFLASVSLEGGKGEGRGNCERSISDHEATGLAGWPGCGRTWQDGGGR